MSSAVDERRDRLFLLEPFVLRELEEEAVELGFVGRSLTVCRGDLGGREDGSVRREFLDILQLQYLRLVR